jgi:hypothetical protein
MKLSGTGYTAGGQYLTAPVTISLDGTTAIIDIADEVFTSATVLQMVVLSIMLHF